MAAVDPQKDLVLPPGRQVFILNDKGVVDTWVGPSRVTSSGSNDTAVTWNAITKGFDAFVGEPVSAIRPLIQVGKGEYVVLVGLPVPKPGSNEPDHPLIGTNSRGPEIDVSLRTVVHGPQVFALWPRQVANVIPGHHIALDQFVLVRVFDDQRAKADPDPALVDGAGLVELTMGDQFVIKGTDVSFYMPGPGIEVQKDEEGSYVRNAVTLEQLEYAYLRDQSGEKEYIRGPAVVYPKPTQTFVTRRLDDGAPVKKFRVIELTETSALYVKVTAGYLEMEGPDIGKERKAGDELFLVGRDYPLYWPRIEHMLITQNGSQIHYSIAIPDEGTAYYVRNKRTWIETSPDGNITHKDGVVETIRGPKTLLIDPRFQTLVKRALPLHLVALMYPGNTEAYDVNKRRLEENAVSAGRVAYMLEAVAGAVETKTGGRFMRSAQSGTGFEGDVSNRPTTYNKPHSIDLGSTKYEGAPRMAVRPGYAVLLTNSVGKRRVIQGGQVGLLEYDEFPVVLSLSTGTPKSGKDRRKEVYLRTVTKVSDHIELETNDGVRLTLQLSYRVRFEGDAEKWFDIEDPVGFATDNLRSIIHHAVTKLGIREFYADAATKIRTAVLGLPNPAQGKRPGRPFEENGLVVYDVDVLGLSFKDASLAALFSEEAKDSFRHELQVSKEVRGLALARELSTVSLAKAELDADGSEKRAAFNKRKVDADVESQVAAIMARARQDDEANKAQLANIASAGRATQAELAIEQLRNDAEFANAQRGNEEKIRMRASKTSSAVARLAAIQPELVAALTRLGDVELLDKVAQHLNVQTILGGTSVSDALSKAFAGTRFAGLLEHDNGKTANGHGHHADAE